MFINKIKKEYIMLFSERNGYLPANRIIQIDAIDDDLKNGLLNCLYTSIEFMENNDRQIKEKFEISCLKDFHKDFNIHILNFTPDTFRVESFSDELFRSLKRDLEEKLSSNCWYLYYDAVEFSIKWINNNFVDFNLESSISDINNIISRYGSGYRMSNSIEFFPICNQESLDTIEKARNTNFAQAPYYINKALNAMKNKDSPDYNSVISESINAVESCFKKIIGEDNKTLGAAFKQLKSKNTNICLEFLEPFNTIYGYISNVGLRHGKANNDKIKKYSNSEAIFILTNCSALINYLSVHQNDISTAK
ncbi:AbiJ-NTD4 domain-containing protein [Leuconostoc suionicum]|uniref:AbiJ-NTD4 domain-containing protein n=1 Tax=Leuconostoc suionicum TaxID=1511761 RepID=UPI004036B7A4